MSDKDLDEPLSLDELAAEGDEMEAAGDEGVLERIANIEAERDEFRDKWMRALADAENVRKRADRDRREAENYGGSKLARDLLPVYDNLRRALKSTEEAEGDANKALLEGVELTMRELLNVFKKHGIEPIVPEAGDKFDPQLHQAMFEAPVPGTKSGHILEVMAEGFLLHDRLLRPAQVGVSSMPAS
ncbi:nucleotide exchange factor GrpE [Yoonia sp. R2331]|uniref:nucleotide exchange factor GrpE n=1 Tax=Yoonia sp. R2331 TaxID=3237238 RepID=UPI0034E38E4D